MILSIAFMAGFFVNALAQWPPTSFTVDNRTGCDVYCVLWGKPNVSASCVVPFIQSSVPLVFSPGTVFFPDPSAVPIGTLAPGDNFVGADIYDADANSCFATLITPRIGEPCGSYPLATPFYTNLNNSCQPCGLITAIWDVATSTLIFQ